MGCQPSLSEPVRQQSCQPKHQLKQQVHALIPPKYVVQVLSQNTDGCQRYPQLQARAQLANTTAPVQ